MPQSWLVTGTPFYPFKRPKGCKLDECLDVRLARLFEDAGHDAETVFSEKIAGAADRILYVLAAP